MQCGPGSRGEGLPVADKGMTARPYSLLKVGSLEKLARSGRDDPEVLRRLIAELEQRKTLGLDYLEGRTWTGWHHHVTLVSAAHLFASTLRLELAPRAPTAI